MKEGALKFVAALIITLMVSLPFFGIDRLSRDVRKQIASERTALQSAQAKLREAQQGVAGDLQAEADLFSGIPASQGWAGQLELAANDLQSASRDMEQLTALEKADRRSDRERALALLSHERQLRTSALNRATAIQKEASRWMEMKRKLPETLAQMERDYSAIHGFDFGPLAATIQKAAADYPEKKADLENRLAAVRGSESEADTLWKSTADARRQAAANNLAGLDFAALLTAADKLRASAQDLPGRAEALTALTGQLYTSWDKVLVDMRRRDHEYNQQIRTITTRDGNATSDEKWITVSRAQYQAMQNNLGMAIEHKSTGKYDSEADRVAQPAGFAYMAPPGERNRYGYWENRGGQDFWVFYGQYALLRDLLFNRDYRSPERGDWEGYRRQQSRGETYYGTERGTQAPKYGTQAPQTHERYSGSSYSRSGGFKDSPYATKSGGYRQSPYASPGARQPGADTSPRSFGRGGDRREAVPAPSRPSYRPPSRPAPRQSAPRRFGKH